MYNDSETVISAEQLGRSVPRPDVMLLNPPARTRVSDEYACMPNPKVVCGVFGYRCISQGGAPAESEPTGCGSEHPGSDISRRPLAPHGPPRVTGDRRQ